LPKAHALAKQYKLRITGIQQHIGSNALDVSVLVLAIRTLLKTASSLKDITYIDFGGGLGIPYTPHEKQLDLKKLGKEFKALTQAYVVQQGRGIVFSMEPGRFIVAEAGSLLVSVVDSKETSKHLFAGVNSGFNQLIRPTMYGSYHPIENLSRTRGRRAAITIAGNVCESGDVFATDRTMLVPEIGDVLAIRNAGAYGFTMASTYNMHALPREVLSTSKGTLKDISFSPFGYAL
jgi:diaminopimelate decarboxylase